MIKQTNYIFKNNTIKVFFKDSNLSVEGVVVDIDDDNCVLKSISDNDIIFIPNMQTNVFAIKVISELDVAKTPTKPTNIKLPQHANIPSPEEIVEYKKKEVAQVQEVISKELTTPKIGHTRATPQNINVANKHYSQGNYGLPNFSQKPITK
jgi:hypothetical protein